MEPGLDRLAPGLPQDELAVAQLPVSFEESVTIRPQPIQLALTSLILGDQRLERRTLFAQVEQAVRIECLTVQFPTQACELSLMWVDHPLPVRLQACQSCVPSRR